MARSTRVPERLVNDEPTREAPMRTMQGTRIQRYFRHGTLPQLRVFEAVARLGSFTRAGEETHMAQPTVSVHMKKLCETVGVPLVAQVGKRLRLTPAGEELYAACERIFQVFTDLDGALPANGNTPALRLVPNPPRTAAPDEFGLGAYNGGPDLDPMTRPEQSAEQSAEPGPPLIRSDEGGVATLTLNRPQQYNALDAALIDALQKAVDDIAQDESVRVVVISGAGKAFCAGHDLKELRANPELVESAFSRFSHLMVSLTRMPQPVIARVHGFAFAAGCQLVAQCDLAVATSVAQFSTSGVKFGLFCNTPGVALARNISRKHALEMLLTGDAIDARTALERGLVNRVVEPPDLDAAIGELTVAIIEKTPVAVAAGKRTFYEQIDAPLDEAYRVAAAAMVANMGTQDAMEGIDAFAAKRKPVWQGK
jgi:enoyl-CoA hydratase/carnithine racemase